jgi:hypothetical protein
MQTRVPQPPALTPAHGRPTAGHTFLRMFYLEKACEIQVDARSGGARPTLPSAETAEYAARQFSGEPAGMDCWGEAARRPVSRSRTLCRLIVAGVW